jgi:antirestriction protein ArdC
MILPTYTCDGKRKSKSKSKPRDENTPRRDLHKEVTDKIIKAIEAGAGKFEMPWHRPGVSFSIPVNAVTGKRYNGVNILALWVAADEKRYDRQIWATYKQWAELGAQVRGGEKSSLIVKYGEWKPKDADDDDDDAAKRVYAKPANVFNIDQVDDYEAPPTASRPDLTTRLAHVDALLAKAGVKIKEGGHRAFYCPVRSDGSGDFVQMPPRNLFVGTVTSTPTEAYESTRLHEASHWTSAPHRLNRQLGRRFGDEAYAVEELIAELSAAFLCAELDITNAPRLDHAQYIENWLRVLKGDMKAIFTAASQASKAADYLVARQ